MLLGPESTATQTTCLSGAVPQGSRKPAFDETAVQLAMYSWESSRITSSIARIIMEERMGLLVDQAALFKIREKHIFRERKTLRSGSGKPNQRK